MTDPTYKLKVEPDACASIHVTEAGVTMYANRAMLKALIARLEKISESPDGEFYETHLPSEFYTDVSMFDEGAKNRNVVIVLSDAIAQVFKTVPDFVDVDGTILKPQYGVTIMHHDSPLSIPKGAPVNRPDEQ